MVLKTEFYEKGQQLRKQLTVEPSAIQKTGNIWYPAEMLMKDLRDKTETRLLVRRITTGEALDDSLFDEKQLKQADIPPVE